LQNSFARNPKVNEIPEKIPLPLPIASACSAGDIDGYPLDGKC
jgi:hypothetical protein